MSQFTVEERERLLIHLDSLRFCGKTARDMAGAISLHIEQELESGEGEPRRVSVSWVAKGLKVLAARDRARLEEESVVDEKARQFARLLDVQDAMHQEAVSGRLDTSTCPHCQKKLPVGFGSSRDSPGSSRTQAAKMVMEANKRLSQMAGMDQPAQVRITGGASEGLREALLLCLSVMSKAWGDSLAQEFSLVLADAVDSGGSLAASPEIRAAAERLSGSRAPQTPRTIEASAEAFPQEEGGSPDS